MEIFDKSKSYCKYICKNKPDAVAHVKGGRLYPDIKATVNFYDRKNGVIVAIQASGLPLADEKKPGRIFAVHIHDGMECTGTKEDEFSNTKGHYNPSGEKHPFHAGDMPPLFANGKTAWYAFFTGRFKLSEVLGKTVIIHSDADDFTTQPSGNSGKKIACGIINATK